MGYLHSLATPLALHGQLVPSQYPENHPALRKTGHMFPSENTEKKSKIDEDENNQLTECSNMHILNHVFSGPVYFLKMKLCNNKISTFQETKTPLYIMKWRE